jgi:hypothetical protein
MHARIRPLISTTADFRLLELACGQSIVDAGRAEVRAVGGDPDVGCQRQAQAPADGRAVHRSDHRLMHLAQ